MMRRSCQLLLILGISLVITSVAAIPKPAFPAQMRYTADMIVKPDNSTYHGVHAYNSYDEQYILTCK